MTDFFNQLLSETHDLRRKLQEANIDISELRPFAITREEYRALLKLKHYFSYDHDRSYYHDRLIDLGPGGFEINGFRFVVTDYDGDHQ